MNRNNFDKEMNDINEYLNEIGEKKISYCFKRANQIKSIILGKRNNIIVSNDFIIRKVADIRGIRSYRYNDLLATARRLLAFRDGLYYLARKNIPVFFYNRIDKKNDFQYAKTAQNRMNSCRSFPIMYQSIDKYENDFKELIGEKYTKQYVEDIGKIPQVIKIGNLYCHEDYKSKYVNVVNGMRVTKYQPDNYVKTIHVYGRCGAFGYAVEDAENIPSQIQRQLIEHRYTDIRVVNHGLWGGEDQMLDHNFLYELQDFKEGDIVLFYRFHFEKEIIEWFEKYGLWYEDITEKWHMYSDAKWCFYDKPGHMNNVGYRNTAEIIVKDLIEKNFEKKRVEFSTLPKIGVQHLHSYVEKNDDVNFDKKIKEYIDKIESVNPNTKNKNNGAIVMNCNPFTLGHRYLIEYAANKVEWLYIFVVEENKSFFEFEDRYKMVVDGTNDLKNVIVVPSGKFIISSYTFPEYFMKDYVKEKNFDVSNDINIFCKYIAPRLSIKKRFVGEEPFDPVTANYNETMKKLLPDYGIEFIEIPRKQLKNSRIINATEVRRLLKNKDYESIIPYVPMSTYKVLENKYFD